MSKGARGAFVDMCGVCEGGSEGQLDITGVWRTGRSGSPRQGSPATALGTPRPVGF